MVQINFAKSEVQCKVVYYGPPRSGKTANLRSIHDRSPSHVRGALTTIATDTNRTLFFDFLPLNIGTVAGIKTKIHLYAVPYIANQHSMRLLVLEGVDGIVFVADSSAHQLEANREALRDLSENLAQLGRDIQDVPLIWQWNKSDLPDAMSADELQRNLNPEGRTSFAAVAEAGNGVFATLKGVTQAVLVNTAKLMGNRAPDGKEANESAPAAPAPVAAPAAAAAPAPVPPQPRETTVEAPRLPLTPPVTEAPVAPRPLPKSPVATPTAKPTPEPTPEPVLDAPVAAQAPTPTRAAPTPPAATPRPARTQEAQPVQAAPIQVSPLPSVPDAPVYDDLEGAPTLDDVGHMAAPLESRAGLSFTPPWRAGAKKSRKEEIEETVEEPQETEALAPPAFIAEAAEELDAVEAPADEQDDGVQPLQPAPNPWADTSPSRTPTYDDYAFRTPTAPGRSGRVVAVAGAVPVQSWEDEEREVRIATDRRRKDRRVEGRRNGRRQEDWKTPYVPASHVAAGTTFTLVALAAVGYLVHILL